MKTFAEKCTTWKCKVKQNYTTQNIQLPVEGKLMKGLFLHVDSFGVAWLLIFRLQRMFLCFCDNFLQKKLYNDCRTSLRIIHQMLFFPNIWHTTPINTKCSCKSEHSNLKDDWRSHRLHWSLTRGQSRLATSCIEAGTSHGPTVSLYEINDFRTHFTIEIQYHYCTIPGALLVGSVKGDNLTANWSMLSIHDYHTCF